MSEFELSYPVSVDGIRDEGEEHRILADETERRALAVRFDLQGLPSLSAVLQVRRLPHRCAVRVDGVLEAEAWQTCVVTLEPVLSRVEDRFTILFDSAAGADVDGVEVIEAENAEDVEPLEGDTLDLGELVATQLSLALPAYPRAPGAERSAVDEVRAEGSQVEEAKPRPFAGLDKLMKNQ